MNGAHGPSTITPIHIASAWYRTSDVLPEADHDVLLCIPSGRDALLAVGHRTARNAWRMTGSLADLIQGPTHWQPLPAPPEELR